MNLEGLDILSLIQPELAILIPMCWGLGLLIKSIKIIKNKYIPLILAICSVIMATLYIFAIDGGANIALDIFMSITQGIVAWGIAWISYEKVIKCKTKNE